jgi:hypothetical protein
MNLYSDRLGKLNFDGTDGSLNYINLDSKKSIIIGENAGEKILVSNTSNNEFNVLIGNNVIKNGNHVKESVIIGYGMCKNINNGEKNVLIGYDDTEREFKNINNVISIGYLNIINSNINNNLIYGNNNKILSENSILIGNNNNIYSDNNIYIGNNLIENCKLNIDDTIIKSNENYIYIGANPSDKVLIGHDIRDNNINENLSSINVKNGLQTDKISINNVTLKSPNISSNIEYILPNNNINNSNEYLLSIKNNKELYWKDYNSLSIKSLDDISNGNKNKYITDNIYNNNLTIKGLLTVHTLNVIGNTPYITNQDLYNNIDKFIGPRGLKGDKGQKGDTGVQGIKGDKGDGYISGTYNSSTGIIKFISNNPSLNFETLDIRGDKGDGFTSASYNIESGKITFRGTKNELNFTTESLKGEKGEPGTIITDINAGNNITIETKTVEENDIPIINLKNNINISNININENIKVNNTKINTFYILNTIFYKEYEFSINNILTTNIFTMDELPNNTIAILSDIFISKNTLNINNITHRFGKNHSKINLDSSLNTQRPSLYLKDINNNVISLEKTTQIITKSIDNIGEWYNSVIIYLDNDNKLYYSNDGINDATGWIHLIVKGYYL